MSLPVALVLSVILVIVNGFFVAVELALVASRRSKLAREAEAGRRGARAALDAIDHITRSLFAAQLGITVCSLLLGLIAEKTAARVIEDALAGVVDLPDGVLHAVATAIAISLVVSVHTVLGEMVPKNMAIARPEPSARLLAPIHATFVAGVRPIIWLLKAFARPLLRLAGIDADAGLARAPTSAALARMIDASKAEGLVDEQEHVLLTGALDFGDTRVRSVMIPFDDIVSAPLEATVDDLERLVVAHGHNRIPMRQAGGHDFRGFVHAKDLVWLPDDASDDVVPVELIRRMPKVSIEQTIENLLFVMQRTRKHMALVTAGERVVGMATLEDILEELVGEVYDETDHE